MGFRSGVVEELDEIVEELDEIVGRRGEEAESWVELIRSQEIRR